MIPDKTLILAETQRKAKKDFEQLYAATRRYALIAVVCGVGFAAWMVVRLGLPVPLALVLFIVFPLFCYVAFRLYVWSYVWNPIKALLEDIEKEPQNADDYSERAYALYCYGFYEAAIEDYRSALEMEPDNDVTWFDLAETLWELHRRDEALPIVEKLSAVEGDMQTLALVLQGKILTEENPTAALACFDKAIEIYPQSCGYHLARLRCYIEMDWLDRAAEVIAEIPKMMKKDYRFFVDELYELRGRLALKQGRFADAVRDFGWAIWNCSSDATCYRLRSEAHGALGHLDKAEADRRKADALTR